MERERQRQIQRKKGDFDESYNPVQNFWAKQVSAFQEGVEQKRKNSSLLPESSLLFGLTLECRQLPSISPDGKYGLKPLFGTFIFTNVVMC